MTFDEAYQNHFHTIRKFILSKLKNDADADDVTQEVFKQFFRIQGRFEERDQYVGLLMHTARFCIGHFIAKNTRRVRTVPIEDKDFGYTPRFRNVSRNETLDKIWQLKRLYRRSIVMYFFADMTFKEIGDAMGTTDSTAQYRVKTGLKQLKPLFGSEEAA